MKAITVTNQSLTEIALKELGDSTQWVRIAQINGLFDPVVRQTQTIFIPAVDPTLTGGVPE